MQIQDFLIAAVQNITILIRKGRKKLSKSQAKIVQGRYDLESRTPGLFSKATLWIQHGLWKTGYQNNIIHCKRSPNEKAPIKSFGTPLLNALWATAR
jgi:hypothetical protein